MAINFRVKWVKSADSPSFVALAFVIGVAYRDSDFKRFICNDNLATVHKNWVNVGSVTLGFKRGKDVHRIIDWQFGYICLAPPLTLLFCRPVLEVHRS